MSKSPHAGERGVSVLGALVVALMLGAGAVATFELATPPLSSVAGDTQVAVAASPTEGSAKAEQEKLSKEIEKICSGLKSKATKPNQIVIAGSATTKLGKGETVEANRCVSYFYGAKECSGMDSKVVLKRDGTGEIQSIPNPNVKKGECQNEFFDENGKPLSAEEIKKILEKSPELSKDLTDALGSQGTLDKATQDALQKVLDGEIEDVESKIKDQETAVKESREAYEAALDKLAKCVGDTGGVPCDKQYNDRDDTQENLDQAQEGLEKLQSRLAQLRENQKKLSALENPPGGDGNTPPPPPPGPPPPPPPSPSTFPPPGGPGGGGGMPQGLGGQPPPGNQMPRPPGTCYGGQTICQGNTLYSRNNQCVDTPVQYCQYGCAQGSGDSRSSGLFGLFGGSGSGSNKCAPPPQQGQNCPPAPVQPQQPCQDGTWKPTYGGQNNSCVVGWQCVPTGSGGTSLTAQLSCQPQIADVGMTIAITYSCSSGTSSGSGFQTNGAQTGSTTVTIANPPLGTNVATYGLTCTDEGRNVSKDCSIQVAKPGIVLITNPKTVFSGTTSAIGWVTSGMQSCVISSPDLPSFTEQNKNATNVNGAVVTPPLSSAATFVLKCVTIGGGTRQASTIVTVQ